MPAHTHPLPASDRGLARRDQVRTAAADCFRRHGFHGTSVAQIAKAAGMSAGHIYHYFENKEAIIADIVAQDLERLLTLNLELRSAHDVKDAVIERTAESVEANLDPAVAGLKLEILAEAARNPRVAAVVRSADRQCRESLAQTIRSIRGAQGQEDEDAAVAGMVEVLAAMFQGLLIRSVRNPELDKQSVVRTFRRMIHGMLTQPVKND